MEYDDESVTRVTKYQWKRRVKNKVNITVEKVYSRNATK